MDKAGPSGDYDGSNTSIREATKPSTLIIEEVFDANESCFNRLNNIRRGLNLPELKEYHECLPNAFIDSRRNNYCTISITEGSGFSSEQTSPSSTFRHGSVNNNFRSTTSFNLIKDFNQPNSPCSRPDTATTENSSDHFFICAHNTDFTNQNIQSTSSIDPFAPELHLDLTESIPNSSAQSTSPNTANVSSPTKKPHLSCDDIEIEYELSSCELKKIGPVNNWSASVGRNYPENNCSNPLSARCIEVPPKRMRIRLNTPRFSNPRSSPSAIVQSSYTKPCPAKENTEVIELQDFNKLPSYVNKAKNYEFRGCLSAVDGQCETLVNQKLRNCKSNQINYPDTGRKLFKNVSKESNEFFKTSTGESFSQICKEIQACINLEEESKKSLSNKSSTNLSNLQSQENIEVIKLESKESKLMIASRCSDISSSSRSTTSYELLQASKKGSYLVRSENNHSDSSQKSTVENKLLANVRQSATTVNSFIEDFNEDLDICNHCEVPIDEKLDFAHLHTAVLHDHCSFSRPTTDSHSHIRSCESVNLKINIPSSAEDEDFVNVNSSCLEPNITTLESGKKQHHDNKFRFWRFKRRKDRLGSGDTTTNSDISRSDNSDSKSSLSYIVSPVGVEMDNDMKIHMITKCGKPNKKAKSFLELDKKNKSKDSVDFEEREISLINYSDFCLPIKSLDKLPDEKSVKDILQSMSQSIFKKSAEPVVEEADSIGDCNDLKENLILHTFSNYSQFKTRAELLAEHVQETEKEKDEQTELSKIIKEAQYPIERSYSNENSEGSYYLNRRKPQNTHIRFYEIPSPHNSNTNLNREDEEDDNPTEECKHNHKNNSDKSILKIDDDEDDDIDSGFCANCFCKHLLFPKMSRSYFL